MNALLRLSHDKSSLLRIGALALGVYVLLFALVSLQLGGQDTLPTSNAALGVDGWTEALEPSVAGTTLDQIRSADTLPAQADLQTIVIPQIERQTLVVPAAPATSSPPLRPAEPLPSTRGADNGPQPPSVAITQVTPERPRVGSTTQVRFQAGDLDGILRAIAVDWGDGRTDWAYLPDRCTGEASEPEHSLTPAEHTYDEIGTYQITVTVFSAGTCERGAIQFGTDQVDVEVGVYVPATPTVTT